jgi:hypothetical protein
MRRIWVLLVLAMMIQGTVALTVAQARSRQSDTPDRTVRSDFNGDGFADLAIGVPNEDVGSIVDAGAVHVIYGSSTGLQATGTGGPDDQYWTQDSPGVQGEGAERRDRFGDSLSAGDFNGDGFADLAMGAPYEDTNGIYDVGAVTILYGSTCGLQADPAVCGGHDDQYWSQDSPGVQDSGELRDQFGITVVAKDFNGDGFQDLAVGIPDESIEGLPWGPGAVSVLYGSANGLQADGTGGPDDQFWTQDSPSVKDRAEGADAFGAGVTAGDFNADGYGDLVVGTPLEDSPRGVDSVGSVNVLYGSPTGLQATAAGGPDDQFWTQDSPGVDDASENGDHFGIRSNVGDFNGDGFDDLAVTVRYEDIGDITDAGGVNVLYGSASGLQSNGNGGPVNQFWTQDSAGVEDTAEAQDEFGRDVTTGDFNADGFADLAIGVDLETEEPGPSHSGAVSILYGSATGLQATGTGGPDDQFWTQNSPGIAGDGAERNDRLGRALAAGDFNGDGFTDLAAGSIEGVGSASQAGAVNVMYGSTTGIQVTGTGGPDDQFWTQNSPGIAGDGAESNDEFGLYLTAED